MYFPTLHRTVIITLAAVRLTTLKFTVMQTSTAIAVGNGREESYLYLYERSTDVSRVTHRTHCWRDEEIMRPACLPSGGIHQSSHSLHLDSLNCLHPHLSARRRRRTGREEKRHEWLCLALALSCWRDQRHAHTRRTEEFLHCFKERACNGLLMGRHRESILAGGSG